MPTKGQTQRNCTTEKNNVEVSQLLERRVGRRSGRICADPGDRRRRNCCRGGAPWHRYRQRNHRRRDRNLSSHVLKKKRAAARRRAAQPSFFCIYGPGLLIVPVWGG